MKQSILLIVLTSQAVFAQQASFIKRTKPKVETKTVKDEVKTKQSETKKNATKRKRGKSQYVKTLESQNKLYKSIAMMRLSTPYVWEESTIIKATEVIRGRLKFSILSTNLASPMDISIPPCETFPDGAVIKCEGATSFRRVAGLCNHIVTPNYEVPIKAKILDLDGSFGLRGDKIYTGEEEFVAGIIASEMAQGAIAVSQYKQLSDLGLQAASIGKAQIAQGLINSADELTDILKEKMQSKIPKVFVEGGRDVLVYFDRTVEFNGKEEGK
jgi:hypothetical protein